MYVLALSVAIIIGIAVILLFIGLGQIISSKESIQEKLDAFAPPPAVQDTEANGQQSKQEGSPIRKSLNRYLSGQNFAASIAASLARANLKLTVSEYLFFHAASAGILFLLLLLVTRQTFLAVIGAVVGLFLPSLYVRRKYMQRQAAFQQQLPDILTLLVGSLRSGYGLTIAMETVANQMPPPASEEFNRVVREIGLGASTTQALDNLVRRIRSDDLDLMVTAISVQYEVGGNLATILETITDTIRERVRLKAQLRTLTTQHNMTRYVLTALPLGLGIVMYIINPEYMGNLFTPGITLAIPIAAGTLLLTGYVVMGKLSNIEL